MSRRARLGAVALAAAVLVGAAGATPSGHKWFLSTANPSPRYKVYNHGAVNSPVTVNGVSWGTALATIQRAYARWVAGNVTCTSWSSTYDTLYTTPFGHAAVNGQDGQNLTIFEGGTNAAWTWPHDAATLALTTTTFYTGTGEIFDADMEINNDFSWKAGGEGNQATAYDLESIVTHEAGHFLGLSHTPASTAVMYASFAPGEVRANLSQADLDDVCGVYPGTAPPAQIGTFCAGDQNCSGTYPYCRAPAGTTSSAKICTRECAVEDCPTGYSCQSSSPAGTTGKACLVKPGSTDLCAFCTNDQECSTGLCAFDDLGHRWCTGTCQQAADCGTGYQCVNAGQINVCDPLNGHRDSCNNVDIPGFGGQCTTDAQCAPGYGCTAQGACEATGTVGSRCELSNYCQCGVCIGSADEAYCRVCCGGAGAGGTCSGCIAQACGTGFGCLVVTNTTDDVCAPTSGANSCQACDGSHPCNDGMPCIAGRCHSFCNPDHPGRCQGCFPTTTAGVGVCGCSDQIVGTGSPCGVQQQTGDFLACSAGSWCVGDPPACLAVCTLGDNTTCNAGQTCALVDGKAVCTGNATPAGSRCGASVGACSSTSCGPGLSCYQGRCYEACNPSATAPTCNPNYGCVAVSGGGVCVCSDQRSAAYGPCGAVNGGVFACSNGLVCVQNMCRVPCANGDTCPAGGTCELTAGVSVCPVPPGVDAGQFIGNNGGCGCEAGGWAGVFPVLMILVMLARATGRRSRPAAVAGERRRAS